jgi:hypothetical protein
MQFDPDPEQKVNLAWNSLVEELMAKQIKIWLVLALLLGLLSVACSNINSVLESSPETTNPDTFALDELFSLGGGETAVFNTNGLQLHFSEVVEDSRCPTEVECFWTGQAVIIITAEEDGEAVDLEFNTNPAPGQTIDVLPAFGYMVHLELLDPYPKNPDNPIVFSDYQAQLIVKRP